MASREIYEHFGLLNISERTVNTVKKELNIQSYKKNDVWYWKLAGMEKEDEED